MINKLKLKGKLDVQEMKFFIQLTIICFSKKLKGWKFH